MRTDMEDPADDVRVLLESAWAPEPRADLSRAVAAGATVRRRRRYAAVVAATVVVVAGVAVAGQTLSTTGNDGLETPVGDTVTSTPAPFTACTVRTLEAPTEGTLVGRIAADPTGRYAVGAVASESGATEAVLWTDGTPKMVDGPGKSGEAIAVNESGAVLGMGVEDGEQFGWLLLDGKMRRLAEVPKLQAAIPNAINARGDVVGEGWVEDRAVVVFWPAGSPKRAVLMDAPDNARPTGIADDGTIVGALGDDTVPYAWEPDGKGGRLALPEGSTSGRALAVHGQWAVGWVSAPPGEPTPATTRANDAAPPPEQLLPGVRGREDLGRIPARWNLATGQVDVWAEGTGPAVAVNSSGWMVVPGALDEPATLVAADGTAVTLAGSERTYPVSISDDARTLYGMRTEAVDPAEVKKGLYAGQVMSDPIAWSC